MSNDEMVMGLMNVIRDNTQLVSRCRCKMKLWGENLSALTGVLLHGREHTTVETAIGLGVRVSEPSGVRVINQLPSVEEIATTLDDLRRAQEEIDDGRQTLQGMGYPQASS